MTQKKILVPIDFSGCSIKALEVAARLALKINAKLVIMNACHEPMEYADATMISNVRNPIREAKSNAKKAYESIEDSIEILQAVDREFQVKYTFPQDAIMSLALMENIDLIVMGTTGASGFKGLLLGSNTFSVIKNVKCPVLTIPEAAETGKYFKNIVLAGDYQNTASKSTFEMLIEISKASSAEIHVLHVSETSKIKEGETEEAQKLDRYFKNLAHSFHFKIDKDVDQGINEYLEENSIDLLTLVVKKNSLKDSLFEGSMIKKMAYHSKTPLLILHST